MTLQELTFVFFWGTVFFFTHLLVPVWFIIEAKKEADERAVSYGETIMLGVFKAVVAFIVLHAVWELVVSIMAAKGIDVNGALMNLVGLRQSGGSSTGWGGY